MDQLVFLLQKLVVRGCERGNDSQRHKARLQWNIRPDQLDRPSRVFCSETLASYGKLPNCHSNKSLQRKVYKNSRI